MQTLEEIRTLLSAHGLSPRKMFGQNFLIDHNLIRRLVDESGVTQGDLVLEVGPGTGALTEELLARGCDVVACEIDRGLCAVLRDRFGGSLTLIEGDCLASKRRLASELLDALGERRFRLVANLPYGAATPLMTELLVGAPACESMHVTIQREVAQRLTAREGTPEYGSISVVAGIAARVEQIAKLPPECFWPRPEVTSAMISVRRVERPLTRDLRGLADFCTMLFSKRRKQLGAVLGKTHPLPEGVDRTQRAEELPPRLIAALFEAGQTG